MLNLSYLKKEMREKRKKFKKALKRLKKIGQVKINYDTSDTIDKDKIYCYVKKRALREAKKANKNPSFQKDILYLCADPILNENGRKVVFVFDKLKFDRPIELRIYNGYVAIIHSKLSSNITFDDFANNSSVIIHENTYSDALTKKKKNLPKETLGKALIDGHVKNLTISGSKIVNSFDEEKNKKRRKKERNKDHFGIDVTSEYFKLEDSTFLGEKFNVDSNYIYIVNSSIKAESPKDIRFNGINGKDAKSIEIHTSNISTKGKLFLEGITIKLRDSYSTCSTLIAPTNAIDSINSTIKTDIVTNSKFHPVHLNKDYPKTRYLNNPKIKRENKISLCRKLIKPEN